MELLLTRKWYQQTCIIGELNVDGTFECFTLEDVERKVKIPGTTAIPQGIYRVIIDWSQKYQKNMPHILNVPGFEGIRIHSGNNALDTEGCILVGQEKGDEMILKSRVAYLSLFTKLFTASSQGKEITITIKKEE
jgi:hypothetical protein